MNRFDSSPYRPARMMGRQRVVATTGFSSVLIFSISKRITSPTCARIGGSFPNFGNGRIRLQVELGGQMPHTDNLCLGWYETPSITFAELWIFVNCVSAGI